jgi:DNA polymerase-3 subunit epsilon
MKALFYDTETTGLPLFSEPSEDPRQPHIVQIAALLVDVDTRKVHGSLDLTVLHDGWESEPKAFEAHGITAEHANQVGVPEHLALALFLELWSRAAVRIGHNEQFDARIVRIGMMRHASEIDCELYDWKGGRAECTQALSTPILRLPPTERMKSAGFNKFKSANLREAYKHFYGSDLVGAHTAMADAQACQYVWFAIKGGARAVPAAAASVHA